MYLIYVCSFLFFLSMALSNHLYDADGRRRCIMHKTTPKRNNPRRTKEDIRISSPHSLIQPVKFNQSPDNVDDLVRFVPGLRTYSGTQARVIDPRRQDVIEHHTQSRGENSDPGPAAESQPAVDDETTAHGVEVDRTGEQEEGECIERCFCFCWP